MEQEKFWNTVEGKPIVRMMVPIAEFEDDNVEIARRYYHGRFTQVGIHCNGQCLYCLYLYELEWREFNLTT